MFSTKTTGASNELTAAELLTVQTISALGDPNADRILFWDDSAGQFQYLTVGSGLTITATTIDAAAASGANTALSNLASVAINTTLVSDTDNTDALGTAAIGWSDIFLGNGAVITFSSAPSTSDVTITHSSNLLTIAGGNLSLGANSLIAHSILGDDTAGILLESTNGTDVAIFGAANTANALFYGAASFTGAVLPTVDNTPALGATGQAWSDLWLGDGAVINFNAGDVTLTHSANTLTLGGGDLALGANNLTMTGSLAATGARATKGWFTDVESTNMPTVGGTAILTSLTAPNFTTIELGAGQTDTTLSRASAGVLAVEGVNVLTTATGLALSGGTMTGSITLGENAGIALDPAGSADGKWSGITVAGTAGYAQTFGDLVYLDPTDSRWEKCDANSAAGADGDSRGIIGIVVAAGAADGNACTVLLHGIIRADAAFPALTINNPIYVSETAGAITQTQPTTTDVVVRIVGFAITADEMYFNPENDYITHT